MRIEKNKSLADFNTFGFSQNAEMFVTANSTDAVRETIEHCKKNNFSLTVIGEGSNIVLTGDIPGITMKLGGSRSTFEPTTDGRAVRVIADAGVSWHQLVLDSIEKAAYGLENLSLIPGTAGAAPIQNIGAYGVELSSCVTQVECIDCATNEIIKFDNSDCDFAYRDSLFKRSTAITVRGTSNAACNTLPRYIITRVEFQLASEFKPQLSYAALANALEAKGVSEPDAQIVSETVIAIRSSKLPDPSKIGNAGSFFKNPVISAEKKNELLDRWPNAPTYPQPDGSHKVAAGWMIETAGWKGKTSSDGKLGVHYQQALVLVNHGGGNGQGLLELADKIQSAVQTMFGVLLEQEPRTLPGSNTISSNDP